MKKIKCINLCVKTSELLEIGKHKQFLFFRLRKFTPEIQEKLFLEKL